MEVYVLTQAFDCDLSGESNTDIIGIYTDEEVAEKMFYHIARKMRAEDWLFDRKQFKEEDIDIKEEYILWPRRYEAYAKNSRDYDGVVLQKMEVQQ